MKAVNVDDVLKILHKYGKYIFVTDEKKYFSMVDEIANLKALEQEPMVEIDLYSVIKQSYIEREALDKIRAEIDIARFIDKDTKLCKNANASGLEVAMQIIDKYKAESEGV
jgi:UDP-galactopyranose mutase